MPLKTGPPARPDPSEEFPGPGLLLQEVCPGVVIDCCTTLADAAEGLCVQLGPECQQAFDTLCKDLTESPVLSPPDPTQHFFLDTDASNVGVGAVLSQAGLDREKVVAYFSRVLNKSERRYWVTQRELLAVVMAVRHFYYLCGAPFVVRSDHAALQWLMSFKES